MAGVRLRVEIRVLTSKSACKMFHQTLNKILSKNNKFVRMCFAIYNEQFFICLADVY